MLVNLKESQQGVLINEVGYAAKVNTDKGLKINVLFKRENRLNDVRLLLDENELTITDASDNGEDEIYKQPY